MLVHVCEFKVLLSFVCFFSKLILEGIQGLWHSILPLWFPAERSTWRQMHLQVIMIKLSQCPEKHFTLICRHVIFSSVLPARMKRLEIIRMVPFLKLVSLKKIDFTLRYKHVLCPCLYFMCVQLPEHDGRGQPWSWSYRQLGTAQLLCKSSKHQ